jgi:hypothetical protein
MHGQYPGMAPQASPMQMGGTYHHPSPSTYGGGGHHHPQGPTTGGAYGHHPQHGYPQQPPHLQAQGSMTYPTMASPSPSQSQYGYPMASPTPQQQQMQAPMHPATAAAHAAAAAARATPSNAPPPQQQQWTLQPIVTTQQTPTPVGTPVMTPSSVTPTGAPPMTSTTSYSTMTPYTTPTATTPSAVSAIAPPATHDDYGFGKCHLYLTFVVLLLNIAYFVCRNDQTKHLMDGMIRQQHQLVQVVHLILLNHKMVVLWKCHYHLLLPLHHHHHYHQL